MRSLIELCGLRYTVEKYVALKCPLQCKRCNASAIGSGIADTLLGASRMGGSRLSGDYPFPRGESRCCSCEGNHTANYSWCVK